MITVRLIRPGKKIRPIFFFAFDKFNLLYKILPTNLEVCKPTFYTFYTSHLRWKSTMRRCIYIIQTSDRMQYFTVFQDKLHSVNIQDDQPLAFSKSVQKISKITYMASRFSLLTSSRVCEWGLIELRFKIIKNLLC